MRRLLLLGLAVALWGCHGPADLKELPRVVVEARSPAGGDVMVRVVTRRTFAPNLLAEGDYSDEVFAAIERRTR